MKITRRNKDQKRQRQTRRKPKLQFIPLQNDTRVMVLYISYRNYLKFTKRPWTKGQILSDVSGYIGDEHYTFGLKLKERADARKLRRLTQVEFNELLKKSVGNKKYKERPSPPFSAAPLCGYILTGKDGRAYKSVRLTTGTCVWKQTHEAAMDVD
jgi:hypothetical protein